MCQQQEEGLKALKPGGAPPRCRDALSLLALPSRPSSPCHWVFLPLFAAVLQAGEHQAAAGGRAEPRACCAPGSSVDAAGASESSKS